MNAVASVGQVRIILQPGSLTNGFAWLSVLVAALSSVKALNTFFEFGLQGIWFDVINYYTELTQPFRELISRLFEAFSPPAWAADVMILYLVLVAAGVRATVLPLRFDEYFWVVRIKRTYVKEFPRQANQDLKEFLENQTVFPDEEFASATERDEFFEVTLKVLAKRWETVIWQFLKCLTMAPVVTLEPYRMTKLPFRLARSLSKKAKPKEFIVWNDERTAAYSKISVELDMMRYQCALQILLLPVIVILFLLGATYVF